MGPFSKEINEIVFLISTDVTYFSSKLQFCTKLVPSPFIFSALSFPLPQIIFLKNKESWNWDSREHNCH